MENCKNGFGISPLMQELMVYAGSQDCYIRCNEILEHFLSIKVSPSQVYRVTDCISKQLEEKEKEQSVKRILSPIEKTEVLYVEVDGSMISTREEGWKEVKLGRLFKSNDCLNPNSKSSYIKTSQYVGYLGNSEEFCSEMESVIDSYGRLRERLVFINDGAVWIKNWIEDNYPHAISILDYFHACEHLHQFADTLFGECLQEKEQWCKIQKDLLLESKTQEVIENIMITSGKEKDKTKLTNYYQNNIGRMDYKKYRQIGCNIIGSGAIESAHRTVIQKRMKLSGQHWSKLGARSMLQLRITDMNNQWNKVIDIIKKSPKSAA